MVYKFKKISHFLKKTRIMTFYNDFAVCGEIAFLTGLEMRTKGHETITNTAGFNFKLLVPDNPIIDYISVSIPTDANRGISKQLNGRDFKDVDFITYETALFKDGEIIYSNKDGFYEEGIARFFSLNDLSDEINRLKELIENNK
jgi:hypothetical protein